MGGDGKERGRGEAEARLTCLFIRYVKIQIIFILSNQRDKQDNEWCFCSLFSRLFVSQQSNIQRLIFATGFVQIKEVLLLIDSL